MTDCDQVLREIELFLDDELDHSECRHIEEHLSACGSCLQRKEFREGLRALVAKKCGPGPVPLELETKIRALLATEPPD